MADPEFSRQSTLHGVVFAFYCSGLSSNCETNPIWSSDSGPRLEEHMAQLQHNMLVAGTQRSVLSIINGGGKWIELSIEAEQHDALRCVVDLVALGSCFSLHQ